MNLSEGWWEKGSKRTPSSVDYGEPSRVPISGQGYATDLHRQQRCSAAGEDVLSLQRALPSAAGRVKVGITTLLRDVKNPPP